MAAGPSRAQARYMAYKVARRLYQREKDEGGGHWIGGSIRLMTPPGSWCPAYEVTTHRDRGEGRETRLTRVRLIRASNGEAAVITDPPVDGS